MPNPDQNQRIAKIIFGDVYPHYLTKVKKKGRTVDELNEVIKWLTGLDSQQIESAKTDKLTFEDLFNFSKINPKANLISGSICGIKVQEIENPITKFARQLDKLVDDLAKGKKVEKILFEV